MKKILLPAIAGLVIGCLLGIALVWLEFRGVDESFINYLP